MVLVKSLRTKVNLQLLRAEPFFRPVFAGLYFNVFERIKAVFRDVGKSDRGITHSEHYLPAQGGVFGNMCIIFASFWVLSEVATFVGPFVATACGIAILLATYIPYLRKKLNVYLDYFEIYFKSI